MSKSALVKIGVSPEQAQNMRLLRRVRQILDQGDAAVARINATTQERLREALEAENLTESDEQSPTDEQSPEVATA